MVHHVYRARLKGWGWVALILSLALPGCSLANSHAFLPISVYLDMSDTVRSTLGIFQVRPGLSFAGMSKQATATFVNVEKVLKHAYSYLRLER